MVSDVLAGRRSVRMCFRPGVHEALGTNLGKIEEGIDQLTEEERARSSTRPGHDLAGQARRPARRPRPGRDPDDDEDGEPVLKIRSY